MLKGVVLKTNKMHTCKPILCMSRFQQGLKSSTMLESIIVYIEIQWASEGTPTVTLATNSVLTSLARARPGLWVLSGAGQKRVKGQFAGEQGGGALEWGLKVVTVKLGWLPGEGRSERVRVPGKPEQGQVRGRQAGLGLGLWFGCQTKNWWKVLYAGWQKHNNNPAECDRKPGS